MCLEKEELKELVPACRGSEKVLCSHIGGGDCARLEALGVE